MSNTSRSMSLSQRNLLNYFSYLKSRHPLMKPLITLINLIKMIQIPLEMIVSKLLMGRNGRGRDLFILIVELSKFVIKFGVWQGSGWRPIPKQFSVSIDRQTSNDSDLNTFDRVKALESKMDQLDSQIKDSKSKDPLRSYLKGHKSNALTKQPQLVYLPCNEWKSWFREFAHLARPSVYALCLFLVAKGNTASDFKSKKNWIPLLVSLSLDLYSKWPELTSRPNENLSLIESEEKRRRLLDLLWYPLRSPVYQVYTADLLDNIESRVGSIEFLNPIVETIKIYRKLCENVYFYTSAS